MRFDLLTLLWLVTFGVFGCAASDPNHDFHLLAGRCGAHEPSGYMTFCEPVRKPWNERL